MIRTYFFVFCFYWSYLVPMIGLCQTQEDFMAGMSDVYLNAPSDMEKAMGIALSLYDTVESNKDLQSYSNYSML